MSAVAAPSRVGRNIAPVEMTTGHKILMDLIAHPVEDREEKGQAAWLGVGRPLPMNRPPERHGQRGIKAEMRQPRCITIP